MNHNISHGQYTKENVIARRHKLIATGAAVLALCGAASGCAKNQPPEPQNPNQERSAEVASQEKDFATAYTCSIEGKQLDAIAAMVDASKHLFFPGYVQVTLNLEPTSTGKEAIASLSDDNHIVTLSDSVDKDDKNNNKAPIFTTSPLDAKYPDDRPLPVKGDDYKNQVFTVNKDGSAVLKSNVRYLFDDKGETEDVDISITQELYAKYDNYAYLTRGQVACGTIHYDKKRGWQTVNKPIDNPVRVTDRAIPLK